MQFSIQTVSQADNCRIVSPVPVHMAENVYSHHTEEMKAGRKGLCIQEITIKQGVALTGRNTTGPLCSRGAIIKLEAA